MNAVTPNHTTNNVWMLTPTDAAPPEEPERVRLSVLRSLLDLTGLQGEGASSSPVPVLGRVLESTHQRLAVDSLVLAPGVHAYECTAPATACLPLEVGTDETSALLAGSSAFALAALRRANFEIGAHAVVLGLDLVGLTLISVCRLAGAGAISALDARNSRRDRAERLGASRVASPEEPGWAEALIQGSSRGGADVVFATGTDSGQVEAILPYCRKEARVLLLASVPTGPLDLYHSIHTPGRTLMGADPITAGQQWATDAARLLRLLSVGRYRADGLVGEQVKASDAPRERNRLLDNSLSEPTVVLNWD